MLGNGLGDDRLLTLAERFVVAIESIASSLEGFDASSKKAVNRIFPEPKKPTEARITRVPTEEDILEEEIDDDEEDDDLLEEVEDDEEDVSGIIDTDIEKEEP